MSLASEPRIRNCGSATCLLLTAERRPVERQPMNISPDEEAPTDERSGLGLPNHLVPLCAWDSGVNG